MKNASNKMFRYGNIINTIYFILAIIGMVLGFIFVIVGAVNNDQALIDSSSRSLAFGIHLLVATILCCIFVINKAEKEADYSAEASLAPFINAIVFGAVSGNPFYVLAGIFGLIAKNQEKNGQQPAEEKPAEEPKEE